MLRPFVNYVGKEQNLTKPVVQQEPPDRPDDGRRREVQARVAGLGLEELVEAVPERGDERGDARVRGERDPAVDGDGAVEGPRLERAAEEEERVGRGLGRVADVDLVRVDALVVDGPGRRPRPLGEARARRVEEDALDVARRWRPPEELELARARVDGDGALGAVRVPARRPVARARRSTVEERTRSRSTRAARRWLGFSIFSTCG